MTVPSSAVYTSVGFLFTVNYSVYPITKPKMAQKGWLPPMQGRYPTMLRTLPLHLNKLGWCCGTPDWTALRPCMQSTRQSSNLPCSNAFNAIKMQVLTFNKLRSWEPDSNSPY